MRGRAHRHKLHTAQVGQAQWGAGQHRFAGADQLGQDGALRPARAGCAAALVLQSGAWPGQT